MLSESPRVHNLRRNSTLRAGLLRDLRANASFIRARGTSLCVTLVPALLPWTRVSNNPMGSPKVCELKVASVQIPKIPNYRIDQLGLSVKSPSYSILFPSGIHNGPRVTKAKQQRQLPSASRTTLSWPTN